MAGANRNYKDPRYTEFRAAVLKRDKHTCRYPGCRKKRGLQVHHILRWVDSPEYRFSPSNGISLCRKCHNKIKDNEWIYADMFFDIIRSKNDKK